MKKYELLIKSHCEFPDYQDECEANSLGEAAKILLERNKNSLWGWTEKQLLSHIGPQDGCPNCGASIDKILECHPFSSGAGAYFVCDVCNYGLEPYEYEELLAEAMEE